jgi:hypothetical protein
MATSKKSKKQSEPITAEEIIQNEPQVPETLDIVIEPASAEIIEAARESMGVEEIVAAPAEAATAFIKARKYGELEAGGSEEEFLGKLQTMITVGAWGKFPSFIDARIHLLKNKD